MFTVKVVQRVLLLFFFLGVLKSTFASEYYVSLKGNDQNPGTKEQPFRTIQRASSVMRAGDICYLRQGGYHETVRLENLDGKSATPIIFTAFGDEEVTLDGTVSIETRWEKYKDSIYKTKLDFDIWQLFVDGEMMTSARWPNAPAWSDEMWSRQGWARQHSSSTYGHMVDDESWTPENTLAGQGISFDGAIAILNVGYWWTYARSVENHTVGSNSFDYRADLMRDPSLFGIYDKYYSSWYFLEGSLSLLDTAGEWFFDPKTKELYLWTDDGNDPTGRNIRGKTQSYALEITNSNYITFKRIHFFASTFRFNNCTHLTVEDCNLMYPSYSKRMLGEIDSPEITLIKAPSKTSPAFNTIRNCVFAYTDGAALEIWGEGNIIDNCYFHDIDYSCVCDLNIGTISASHTKSVTLRRNTIHTAGNSETINVGESCFLEYNNVYNCGLIQGDGALVQAGSGDEFSVVRSNWFHDTVKRGIRFDRVNRFRVSPFPTHGTVNHNVTWNTVYQGIQIKGEFFKIFNNTSFNGGHIDINIKLCPNQFGGHNYYTVTRNNAAGSIGWKEGSPAHIDSIPGEVSNNWIGRDEGTDVQSQLRDPENHDFRPKPESGLIDAGYIESDLTDDYNGKAPDIGAYEYGEKNYWIPGRKLSKASTPIPKNHGETNVNLVDLMWLEGYKASSHDVYFGLSELAVANANHGSPEFKGNQPTNIYYPGKLKAGTTYYWRIDAISDKGIVKGEVWSYTAKRDANI